MRSLMLDAYPILTLLPPLLAIILVIVTRKVLISLGAGIVVAGLVLAEFNPLAMMVWVWDAIGRLFWAEGELNWFTIRSEERRGGGGGGRRGGWEWGRAAV